MKTIFRHTIMQGMREKYLQVLTAILLVFFMLVGYNSLIAYKTRLQSFETARQTVRKAWLNQGPQNPHSSAHYGSYIFQPIDAMQFLDNGIRPFAGSILRLEAHAQNEATFSPAQDKSELSRFGELSFAWMLQVLMPLFILLLCFNTVSAEKENQNIRLLVTQGVKNQHYLWGKIAANFTIVLVISFVGLCTQLLIFKIFGADTSDISLVKVATWFLLYALYLFIISGLSVLVSARVNESKTSLILQLAIWVVMVVVSPKITANAGAKLYPMVHHYDFERALREDRNKGINGHDPRDQRAKHFQDSLLTAYKVDSLKKLPINADGLLMQADEEYSNKIYDKHFKSVRDNITKQNSISKMVSFINPFLAIRNTSMGISQSDFSSQLDLFAEAETYRRYLINELNTKLAYGGSKTDDWNWTVDTSYWQTIKDFDYPKASLSKSMVPYKIELTAFCVWVLVIVIGVYFTSKKLNVL
jgi:ABC-2 type transport system permease protein